MKGETIQTYTVQVSREFVEEFLDWKPLPPGHEMKIVPHDDGTAEVLLCKADAWARR